MLEPLAQALGFHGCISRLLLDPEAGGPPGAGGNASLPRALGAKGAGVLSVGHPGDKLEPFQDPFLSDGAAPPPLAGLLSPVFSLLVRGPGLPEGGGRLSRVAHRDVNGLR